MVVCKFFLQGTCKFGDSCKFEHQMNDHNYGSNSVLLQPNYAPKAQTTSNVDINTLVKAVVNDMTSAEKGGQWLLSSYAPFKEKPAFPGFEDHSMEEVRHLFYETIKTGNIEQYKQNLQMMLQQAMMKIKALQNPSPQAVGLLKSIYETPPSSTNKQSPFGGSTSVFGGAQKQNVFGNATNTNQGVFGGGGTMQNTTNKSQGVFGGGSTMQQGAFGSGNTSSMFGGAQAQSSPLLSKSIFGGAPQATNSSLFGGAPQATNSSVFGGAPQATNSSVFGGAPQATNSSVFGGTPQASNSSVFGGAPQAANSSVFGGAPQATNSSVFGGAPVFAGGTQQSVFAKQPQQQSPFGQNQQLPFTQQQNVFHHGMNTQVSTTANQFGAPPNATFSNTPGPFGGQQGNFGVAQTAPQAVPPTQQNKPSFQHTQSIFGNLGLQTSNNANMFGNSVQPKPNENYYSKLEELTEEEIKWFQSDDLDIMKIPEKPPTYEMCFKVQ